MAPFDQPNISFVLGCARTADDFGKPRHRRIDETHLRRLADRLSDLFETRVKVEMGQRKGKIVVEFASPDDLERIVKAMTPATSPEAEV